MEDIEAINNQNKTRMLYQLMKAQKPARKITQRCITKEDGVEVDNREYEDANEALPSRKRRKIWMVFLHSTYKGYAFKI